MLYKKKNTPALDMELFRNPTSEYRGAPFWAWNCRLEQAELDRQLEDLKKMGFGGAHLHVRTGMSIPYLSEEYMGFVKGCVEKAKSLDMLAWLYDEDRWPSGSAGGLVTRDQAYRARYLLFTPVSYADGEPSNKEVDPSEAEAVRRHNGTLLACYDVELDADGYLVSAKRIAEDAPAVHDKWYAYLEIHVENPWYNDQAYVNTLDKKAMDRFIEITYEAYNRTVADEFDKTVPSMFTDEPQFTRKSTLRFATDKTDVTLPWTDDLAESYAAAYGEDILATVPELIWDRADGKVSVARYQYHDHICERFTQAYADNCGAWCREHGLALTGHMMGEPTLEYQTSALGEAMRAYRGFDLPGIDMLCAWFEYTTAKQTQSAVHQFGCEGMLSELYGVTNWDFDFRGHKLHGDWQAALGVTARVPHLSLVSLGGESKRDYPASINYQSPWWEKYRLIEDHFARVGTAMTRGKPVVKLGVIHPVESYWLHWGPAESTALIRTEMDQNFQNLTQWLLFGGVDFDFISESLLPSLCEKGGAPLAVGEMAYDVILVPGCETLRSSTLERLEAFAAAGGKLIFAGALPTLENAAESARGAALAAQSLCVPLTRGGVLDAVSAARVVDIRNQTGSHTENLLYQLRADGDGRWLFIAHGKEPYNKDISSYQDLRIRIAGEWVPTVYNTLDGTTGFIDYTVANGRTEVRTRMYDYDSLLLWLAPATQMTASVCTAGAAAAGKPLKLPVKVPYTLSEPNALLLDMAEWALDDGAWQPCEEILRLDNLCRDTLGWAHRKKEVTQPWVSPEPPFTHFVRLRWHIFSEIDCTGAKLAIEQLDKASIRFNGQAVDNTADGWYADRAIKTVALPPIHAGENLLEATVPIGERTGVEWAYLLGDFGVQVSGRSVKLIPAAKELAFGDITVQGLPFYGGNITYHIPVVTDGGALRIRSSQYRGVLQTAALDDGAEQSIFLPPYTAALGAPAAGAHTVHLTLYGHRRNGFGPVHLADRADKWFGPIAWRSTGDRWCYDYRVVEEGVVTTPEITEER